jgi:hypothetical protein
MKSEFFRAMSDSPLLVLPVVSLLLFAGVFTAIVWRTCRRPADTYAGEAALALAKEEKS